MIKRLILSIGLFVASLTGINAQTTLQVGDIAFLAVNHAGDEDFSFILLTDITAGTELFLTDNGWQNSGSFRNNEGILKWTASAAMSCGTEVVINPGLTNASAGSLTIEQANFAISSSGDQILAYQGTVSSPTFVSAIQINGDWNADATNANNSAVPQGLTNGINCIAIDPSGSGAVNGSVSCSLTCGTDDTRLHCNDASNWQISASSAATLPVACADFSCSSSSSNAGEDGLKETCRAGDIFNLFDQLGGTPDNGGSWYDPSGAATTNSQDPATMQPGFYSYIVSSGNACTSDTARVRVKLDYSPERPLITPSGIVNACDGDQVQLVSSSLLNNQWFKDGVLLLGEVNQDLIVTQPGNYWVQVRENGCVSENSDTASVFFNPIVTLDSIDNNSVSCNQGSTGYITIYASGGTGVLKYSIDGGRTFQTGNTFNNLPANVYDVVVKGSKGCTAETQVSLEDQGAVEVTADKTQSILCSNEDNGIIDAVATGGAGSYFFTLFNSNGPTAVNTTGHFENLAEDTYYVVAEDISSGCKDTSLLIEIENPAVLKINATLVNGITCYNDNDAFISAGAEGGTVPYEFTLDGGTTWQSSGNFRNLSGGLYAVILRDANGCTDTSQIFTINNPFPIEIDTVVKENVTCHGADDGRINITASGGTSLMYSLDQTNFQGSGTFNNLMPGTYSITVRDINGCTEIAAPITISEPSDIISSAVVQKHVTCFNGNDGRVKVTGSGGSGNLVYGISTSATFQTSPIFEDLAANTYDFYVQDVRGCIDTVYGITVHQPQRFSLEAQVDSTILCFGDSMGRFTMTAIGGRGPIQYSLDGVTYQSSPVFDSLPGGNYMVRALDSAGCTATRSVQVFEPAPLELTLTRNHITCAGEGDGHIRVNVTGGSIPYSFSIDSGATFQENANFYSLGIGTYGFLVVDNNGCSIISDSVTISEPDTLIGSVAINNHLSCYKSGDGMFSVSVEGGRKPYAFSIDGLSYGPDSVFTDMSAGSYLVKVLDSSGCLITLDPITLNQPLKLQVDTAVVGHITCKGAEDGEITVLASGGVQGLYEYSVDNIVYQSSNVFEDLLPGVYEVTAKDSSGCISPIYKVEIIEPELLEVSATIVNHVTCNGLQDGSISSSVVGGTAPYEYSLNGVTWQSNPVFTGLAGGNYAVRVKDANDCIAVSNSVVIINPPLLSVVATLQEPISCRDANDAIISVQGFGGTGDYLFSIDGVNYTTSTVYANLSPGTYSLSVQDENGCITTAPAIVVNNPAKLNMSLVLDRPVSCPGGSDGRVRIQASGGTGVKLYSKDNINFQQSNIFTGLTAGSKTFYVKDENDCKVSQQITLNQPVPFVVTATVKDEFTGNDGSIDLSVNNVITPISYQWSNGATTQDIDNLPSATYTVTVTDGKGCQQTHSYTVKSRLNIEENDPSELILYPNPTSGALTIDFAGTWSDYELSLTIIDQLGQVVHSEQVFRNASQKEFDFSFLPNGLYHIRLQGDQDNIQKTFIKQ